MKYPNRFKPQTGFSMMELMVSIAVLIPIMGAALSLFSVGAKQQGTEQSSVSSNQEARFGLEMMAREIAQAGSHRDFVTTVAVAYNPTSPPTEQWLTVNSVAGFTIGDWVTVDTGAAQESVLITALNGGERKIKGLFHNHHGNASVPVRLYAYPFETGVIPAAGMGAPDSVMVNPLKFYGDIGGNSNDPNPLYYVEYSYDNQNNQITRSATPVSAGGIVQSAVPFITNIKSGSAHFTVNTDSMGIVTSVDVAFTVQNTVKTNGQYEETSLSTRILVPSTKACSLLKFEVQRYGGDYKLPQTPSQIIAWSGAGGS